MKAIVCACHGAGCTLCLGFGWRWLDHVPPTTCSAPPHLPCGRTGDHCPGCGRARALIGGEIDRAFTRLIAKIEAPPVDVVMKEIADWQAVTFPHQDPQGIGYKLVEEAQEVARAILWEQNVGEEAADVLFMLVSTCSAFGIDLAMEARKKLHKNKKRTWKEPDELGRISHKQDV